MRKRILYIAVTLAIIFYLVNVLSVLFRLAYENLKDGQSMFEGVVWGNVLLPGWLRNKEDQGWRLDAIGKGVAFLGAAYLIVKRKIKTIK